MVTAADVPARRENGQAILGWIDRWAESATVAAAALAPVHAGLPRRVGSFEEVLDRARVSQAALRSTITGMTEAA